MNCSIDFSNMVWPHVEQAISAAKRRANRDGKRISVYQGTPKVADVWPDGRVDLTFAGSPMIASKKKMI